jgi:hypothetical protein
MGLLFIGGPCTNTVTVVAVGVVFTTVAVRIFPMLGFTTQFAGFSVSTVFG